jgi:hypothetical protein
LKLLQQHEARIRTLEIGNTGNKPIITSLEPSGSIQVGQTLIVHGQHFAVPADRNIVTVGGFVIDRFDTISNETFLKFNVPQITFSGTQLQTQVTVRNSYDTASAPISLLPAQNIPKGFVVFSADTANASIIPTANGTFTWNFAIDSQTDIGESYILGVVFSDVSGPVSLQQWQNATTLLLQNSTPVSNTPIQFTPFQPINIKVRIQVPSTATPNNTTVKFALSVKSMNNDTQLSRTASPVALVVGNATPVPDSRVEWANLVPSAATQANRARRVIDAATGQEVIEIPYNDFGLIQVRATFKVDGTYSYTTTLNPSATNIWSILNSSPSSSIGKKAGENELIGIVLRLLTNADIVGSHSELRTLTIKASRTLNFDTDTFDSWITLNVRGYTP